MRIAQLLIAALIALASGLGAQTFTDTATVAIPDGSRTGLTRTINIPATGNLIRSFRVDVRIDHQTDSDFDIYLIPPWVTWAGPYTLVANEFSTQSEALNAPLPRGVIELSTDNGGTGNDYGSGNGPFTYARFSAAGDPVLAGTQAITAGAVAFTANVYLPEGVDAFEDVYGRNPSGTWTLVIADDTAGTAGNFRSWQITYAAVAASNLYAHLGANNDPGLPIKRGQAGQVLGQYRMEAVGAASNNLTSVVFRESAATNLNGLLTSASLYRDNNGDGLLDGGDTLLNTVVPAASPNITFNFAQAIPADTGVDLLLVGTVAAAPVPVSMQMEIQVAGSINSPLTEAGLFPRRAGPRPFVTATTFTYRPLQPDLITDDTDTGITRSITVPATTDRINSLRVGIRLDHTYDADLDFYLLPPGITWNPPYAVPGNGPVITAPPQVMELSTDNGGANNNWGSNLTNYTYTYGRLSGANDPTWAAANLVTGGASPFTAQPQYRIEGTTAWNLMYNGNPSGTWQLIAVDAWGQDVGYLISWQLEYVPITTPQFWANIGNNNNPGLAATTGTAGNVFGQLELSAYFGANSVTQIVARETNSFTIGNSLSAIALYRDVNANGTFEAGTDTLVANGAMAGAVATFNIGGGFNVASNTTEFLIIVGTVLALPANSVLTLQHTTNADIVGSTSEIAPYPLQYGAHPLNPPNTYVSTPPLGISIPDNNAAGITDTITIPATSDLIGALRIGVRIDHASDADLDIWLIPPGVTWAGPYTTTNNGANPTPPAGVIELSTDNGGTGNDFGTGSISFVYARLSRNGDRQFNTGNTPVTGGAAPFTAVNGYFTENIAGTNEFNDLYGTSPVGNWTIAIADDGSGGTGRLISWFVQYVPAERAQVKSVPTAGFSDFGNVIVGSPSAAQGFQVQNMGSFPLTLLAPGPLQGIRVTGANAGDFVIQATAPSGVLAADASTATFNIVFTPSALGLRTANITVTWNNSDATMPPTATSNYAITGTGVQPVIEVREVNVGGVTVSNGQAAANGRAFGNQDVALGPTAALTIVVRNTGTAAMTVGVPTLAGANPGDFVLNTAGYLTSIPAGSNTSFTVAFDPTVTGARGATVTFTHNGANTGSPFTFGVSGTGTTPSVEVREVSTGGALVTNGQAAANGRAFGSRDIAAGPSAALTIFVLNTGTASMTLGTPTLGGANPGEFVLNTSGFTTTVAAGGNTSFTLAFDPSVIGARNATISFTHTGSNTATPFTFSLSGTGTTPTIDVRETAVGGTIVTNGQAAANGRAFGSRDIAAGPSATLSIFVLNTGSAPMTVSLPSLGGVDASQFVLNTAGYTLVIGAGGNTSFTLAFDPSTTGAKAASISITHTGSNTATPFTFSLSGTGTTPTIEVRETAVGGTIVTNGQAAANGRAFGNRDIAAGPSATLSIFVLNTGSATMTLALPVLAGADAGQFVLNTTGFALSLAPAANTSFTIAFDPSTVGLKAASISFTHSGSNTATPFTFSLSGTGTTPAVEVREVSTGGTVVTNGQAAANGRAFGNRDIAAGPTATLSIFVLNTGDATMTLALPVLGGADASQFVLNTTGFALSLAPAANTSFTIAFDPSTVGAKAASISFTHSGSNTATPFTFSLSGTGTQPTVTVAASGSPSETGPVNGTFTITGAPAPSVARSVNFTMTGLASVTTGVDYTLSGADLISYAAGSGTLNLGVSGSATITLTPNNDAAIEALESATLTIVAGTDYAVGGANVATLNIIDNDAATINLANSGSPSEAPANGTFTISTPQTLEVALTVNFNMSGVAVNADYTLAGTAGFVFPSGSVTLGPGVAPSVNVTLTPVNDAFVEGPETAIMTITAGTQYSGTPNTTLTIADNDSAVVTITSSGLPNEAGPVNGTYTVTVTPQPRNAMSVNLSLSGAAQFGAGFDYTISGAAVSTPAGGTGPWVGTVAIPSGGGANVAVNITLNTLNDTRVEATEIATLGATADTLLTDAAYTVGAPGSANLSILDDDIATVTVTQTGTAAEPGTAATYTIATTATLETNLTVNFTMSGTAQISPVADYNLASAGGTFPRPTGTAVIPTGLSSVVITLTPVNDAIVEATETAIMTLNGGGQVSVGSPDNATINITDNDNALVSVTASGSPAEPATGGSYTISTSSVLETNVTVTFTMSGAATLALAQGSDFTLGNATYAAGPVGTAVILSGTGSVIVTFTPVNDAIVEPTESATMTINAVGSVTPTAPTFASFNIIDDDVATITVTASGAPAENPLAAGSYQISTISTLELALTVNFTMSGTASTTSGVDYGLSGAGVTYSPGPTGTAVLTTGIGPRSVSVTLTPVNDVIVEGSETAILSVTAGTKYTGTPSDSRTILDDDVATITVSASGTPAEGGGGATFTIATSATLGSPLTVNFTLSGLASTVNGTDYTLSGHASYAGPTGTATLPAGASPSVNVTLAIFDDAFVEGPEDVVMTLNAGAYNIGGTGFDSRTISDNDQATISITLGGSPSEAGPANGTFTITATPAPVRNMQVDFAMSGTASFAVGGDYTLSGANSFSQVTGLGTVIIGVGGSVIVTLTPVNDAIVEAGETATLTVTADSVATDPAYTGTPAQTHTIADNDQASVSVTSSGTAAEPGTAATYTIQSASTLQTPVTVTFNMSGSAQTSVGGDYNLASAGGGFTGPGGTAVLPVGTNTFMVVTLTPVNDAIVEATETATLTVLTAGQVTAASPTNASLNITDNDSVTVTVTSTGTAAEPGTAATYTIQSAGTIETPVTVSFNMSGSAQTSAGGDYNQSGGTFAGPGGTAVLPVGTNTQVVITLTPVNDAIVEATESATLTLQAIGQVTPGVPAAATLNITDNDTAIVNVSFAGSPSETGPTAGTFTLSTAATLEVALVVSFTMSGSAVAADYALGGATSYVFPNGTATLPIGIAPSVVLTLTPVDDIIVEGTETATLTISGGGQVVVGTAAQSHNIADNDGLTVTVSASGTPAEGGGGATFTIATSATLGSPLTVNFTLSGLASTVNGTDYTLSGHASYAGPTGTATLPAGASPSVLVTLAIFDDAFVEGPEDVVMTLNAGAYNIGGTGFDTRTISDNDQATISITLGGTPSEAGPANGTFTITATPAPVRNMQVDFAMSGTASFAVGGDYTLSGATSFSQVTGLGTVIIGVGGSVIVTLTPVNDAIVEAGETATLTVTADSVATDPAYTGTPAQTHTIADNDSVTVTVTSSGSPSESGVNGTYTIQSANTLEVPVTVTFAMSGVAANGVDYNLAGTGILPVGTNTQAIITLTPVNDARVEATEDAILTLNAGAQVTVGAPGNATLNITDNDVATVTVSTSGTPTEAGSVSAIYTLSTTDILDVPVTVSFLMSGAASTTPGTDYNLSGSYTGPGGSAVLPVGTGTSVNVTLTPIDDARVEANEAATLTVQTAGQAQAGAPAAGTLNITDNDIAVITVTPAGSPSESGATGTYLVATGATLEIALTVNFTMSGAAVNADYGLSGTASYAFPSGSVTLAIGTGSSALVTLTPVNDALVEGPEDATLTVTAGAQYSGTPFGTLTIADNDSVVITLGTLGSPSEAGPTAATFRVTATPQPAIAMSVNISLSGSATFGGAFDYTVGGATITTGAGGAGPWAGTVTIPGGGAGSAFIDITITPVDDARVEATESVNLDVTADTLLSDPAYTGTPSASLNITDNDTASVSVTSSGVAAEPGTGATYIIQSASIIDVPVTVTFTMSGSAQTSLGGDYNFTSAGGSFTGPGGTAILPVGTNTQITVTLTPVNDAIVEATETAVLTVLTAGQVTASSPVSASLNITDDDTATVNVSFAGSPSETGPTSGTFTLSTTATLEVALTVNFNMSGAASTVPGTDYNLSSAGGSYTGPGGTAVLPVGATPSVVITLAPIDDISVEGGETATLTISGGGQVAVGTAAQTHTIADNDTPTVTISASGTPAEGSAALGTFTIATSATLAVPLTVNFTLSGLASTASGVDYTLAGHASYANPTGTVTLPAGVAPNVNVTFSVFNDIFVEGPEDVVMTLNAGLYTVGGPGFGALTIADNDTAVITMSQSGLPGETGPAGGTYTITVTPQPRHAMSVNVSLSGSAQFGVGFDYTISGASITTPAGGTGPWLGTVTIPAGTSLFVNVPITLTPIDDARVEATETAALTVAADTVNTDPAYSGTPSESHNIADNDSASVSVTSSGTASEAGATATYTIQSASTLETPVTVNFTMSGSGTLMLAPGADFSLSSSYTGPTGSAVLPVGTNTFVFVTLSATDDAIVEATESATLTLNAGAQVTVGAPSAASLNITDNDVAQVSVTSSGTPTESGASATFTLSTSATLETPISVSFNMSGPGTLQLSPGADFSISGASYTGPGGTATLPVGAGSFVVITLSATNDAVVEPTEIATLTVVTGGQAAATAPVSAVLGILDNDTATITVTSSGAPSESGATGTYTIATADTLEVALTVNFTMSGAAVNADYALAGTAGFVFPSGSVTLATGVGSSAIVTLTPVNDAIIEATEDAILTLTTGTQWVAGAPAAATLNITDNDTATITVTSTGSPAEGGASATFTVSTTDTLAVALTINFTMAGLADVNSGVDYTLAGTASYAAGTGSVTLAAGVAPSAILTLNVNDDAAVEGPEDAQLNLAGGSQYSVGAPASATLSIADNDFATLSVTAAGSPNETGPVNGTYTITATPAPQHAMSVNFAMGGSASFAAGGDYTLSGTTSFSQITGLGTATIPPSGSVVITLSTIDDAAFEATESATLSVTADSINTDPDYIGTPSDTLNILDNDQPIVSVVGGPFNFGGTEINTFSAPSSYTVSGVFLTADIVINAPAQFQVALSAGGPWLSSLNLTPVANTVPSTSIFVRFAPTALGAAGGNVTNSSTGATTQNVAVSGNGTGITVSAASLGFGAQYVGTASAAQTYTVQAEGLSSDLIISAPAGFQLSSTGGAPWFASLNLGSGNIAPTLISVRFAPTSAGAASGNVSNSSSGFATRDVNVSGNGVAGVLGISGTQNHGSVAITQSGASILYTITNTATGPTAASLTVNSVTLGGANPGDFALSGFSTTLPTALSPGASFTFLGTFTPTAQGVRNADIIINSNTGTEPPSNTSYAINGTGTPGLFAATPTFPAQIDNGGPVVVRCVISALANTTADVAVEYIGGTRGTWTPATLVRTNAGSISGNVISAMSVAAAGSTLEIYWDAYATERHITAANYQIRFIPSNGLYGLGTTGTSSAFTLARQGGWAMHTIPTDLLTGRYGHASVFDAANDRAIVFGGHNGGQLNDVWAFDRSGFAQGWHKINVAGAPPLPRQYSTAVYDAAGQRMIMFGGYNTGVIRLNDVWALSLTRGSETWTQLAPSGTLPGARYYQSMALDAARNRALLFGGVTSSGNMNDVWALSLNVGSEAWTQLAPSGTAPTARFGSSIVVDAPRDRLVIYGGDTSSGSPSTQVFALSLSPGTETWSTLSPATPNGAPAARELATCAYAANREALFVEGGYTAGFGYATDSWLLDLNGGETWTRIAPDIGASQGRVCGTAAYDAARGQLAIFGGLSMYGTIQTPLVLLDTSGTPAWSHPAGTSGAAVEPAQRWGASMVFDANFPGNGRVLTFGGACVGNRFNDVWYIDHSAATPQWVMLSPTGTAPPARTYAATIYDPTPGFERMIVFGGLSASNTVLNDLWVLDLSVPGLESWSQLVVGGGPSARYSSVALFDPNGGSPRMLLHGGNDGVRRNDVWALTLSGTPTWSLIPVASGTPSPGRFGHGATLDTAGNRLIVFYGNCIGGYLQDTWSFDLGTRIWTNISQPSGSRPSGREVFSSGSAGTRAYIHGGYGGSQLGDSWQLDVPAFPGTVTWTQYSSSSAPLARYGGCGCVDGNGCFVTGFGYLSVGASLAAADLWFIDPLNATPSWQLVNVAAQPSAQVTAASVFDPVNRRMIVFGGLRNGVLDNRLWQLDLAAPIATWSELATVTSVRPAPRRGAKFVYDPLNNRLVMYGGFLGATYTSVCNELWQLNLATGSVAWTQLFVSGGPPALSDCSFIYDPVSQSAVLFGGQQTSGAGTNGLWRLSLSGAPAWTTSTAVTRPAARLIHSAIYDAVGQRMIMFGGYNGLFDLWSYNIATDTWTQLFVANGPVGRYFHSAVYDSTPGFERMLVFGGYNAAARNDLWALDLRSGFPLSWTQLTGTAATPQPRWAHGAVFDTVGLRMVIAGGYTDGEIALQQEGGVADTWFYGR